MQRGNKKGKHGAGVNLTKKLHLVVTTLDLKISGCIVTNTLNGIDWDSVDGIIYNSSIDDNLSILTSLSSVATSLKFFIYISNQLDETLYGVFVGLHGDIYDDDSLLQDTDSLNYLISDYGSTGLTVSSLHTDFMSLRGTLSNLLSVPSDKAEILLKSDIWRSTVSGYLENIDKEIARINKYDSGMIGVLSRLGGKVAELSDKVDKIQSTVETVYSGGFNSGPITFSTYNVPSATRRILYVKVYSPCAYLTSFFLSYQHYLKNVLSTSCKILLIIPNLPAYEIRYKDMNRLASDSIGAISSVETNKWSICCTSEPKKAIMDRFFDSNDDLFIVIDQMYSNDLVAGAHVKRLSAVSGIGDVDKFRLNVNDTFFSVSGWQEGYIIPYIRDYGSASEQSRLSLYFDNCSGLYNRLNKIFKIGE